VKKRINSFRGVREYPDGAWLCDYSSLAGGQDAAGLLAVNGQYRSHKKSSMGREPGFYVTGERSVPTTVSPDSG